MRSAVGTGQGLALAFLLSTLTTPASASLIGSHVSWQYYAYSGPYFGSESSGSFIANGTVQGQFIAPPTYFNIIVGNSTVTFDYSVVHGSSSWTDSALSLAPTIHNGIALNFSDTSITGLSIDPLTNMVGFNTSDISFTSGQIQVDWANLPFNPSTEVVLDVSSTATAPEPTVFALITTALAALGCLRRWKTR